MVAQLQLGDSERGRLDGGVVGVRIDGGTVCGAQRVGDQHQVADIARTGRARRVVVGKQRTQRHDLHERAGGVDVRRGLDDVVHALDQHATYRAREWWGMPP